MTKDGYCIYPFNVDAVQNLKGNPSQTIGWLRKILGFLSYHRRYIKDFAKIAYSLYSVLSLPGAEGTNDEQGDKAKGRHSRKQTKKKMTDLLWYTY